MFVRSLISRQSLRVAVVAQQSIVEAFAALRRIRDRRAPDDETVVFDAGEVFEGFELGCELVFVGLGDFGAEFEEDLVCEFWLVFLEMRCGWSLLVVRYLPMWMTVMVVGGSFRMLQVLTLEGVVVAWIGLGLRRGL
jgi:hypothetical protein